MDTCVLVGFQSSTLLMYLLVRTRATTSSFYYKWDFCVKWVNKSWKESKYCGSKSFVGQVARFLMKTVAQLASGKKPHSGTAAYLANVETLSIEDCKVTKGMDWHASYSNYKRFSLPFWLFDFLFMLFVTSISRKWLAGTSCTETCFWGTGRSPYSSLCYSGCNCDEPWSRLGCPCLVIWTIDSQVRYSVTFVFERSLA